MTITPAQRAALKRLASLHNRFPEYAAFRGRFFGQGAAVHLRAVAVLGLVDIDKRSHAFRYAITENGRHAANGGGG